MKTSKPNPLHAVVLPLQGRQMPKNWQQQTNDFGGTFDRRDLENLWLTPRWQGKLNGGNVDNISQSSRLKPYPPEVSI